MVQSWEYWRLVVVFTADLQQILSWARWTHSTFSALFTFSFAYNSAHLLHILTSA